MATCTTYAQNYPDDRAARAFPQGCRLAFAEKLSLERTKEGEGGWGPGHHRHRRNAAPELPCCHEAVGVTAASWQSGVTELLAEAIRYVQTLREISWAQIRAAK